MKSARKARASEMLAVLLADRFKLYREADLIALDIPAALLRSTQERVDAYRQEHPFNPDHEPNMTPTATAYWDHVLLAREQSMFHHEQRKKNYLRVKALSEKAATLGYFDKPLTSTEVHAIWLWHWHGDRIANWHESSLKYWNALTAEERMWFTDYPAMTTWAYDMPILAPAPQCFWPLKETAERQRQAYLLRWVIKDCEGSLEGQ